MINIETRCPRCREKVRQFSYGRGRSYIGFAHAPTCTLYKLLVSQYPKLVERIEKERSAA